MREGGFKEGGGGVCVGGGEGGVGKIDHRVEKKQEFFKDPLPEREATGSQVTTGRHPRKRRAAAPYHVSQSRSPTTTRSLRPLRIRVRTHVCRWRSESRERQYKLQE